MKESLFQAIKRIADATITLMHDEYENFMPEINRWDWQPGVGLYGLIRVFEFTGEQQYLDYSQYYVNRLLDVDVVSYSINGSMLFEIVLKLFEHCRADRYQTELHYYLRWLLRSAAKCQNGCFEHSWTETNVHLTEQVWIDTLFMAGIVLADSHRLLGREDSRQELIRQFAAHQACLQDAETGLYRHFYDANTDSHMAGAFWGRGNGWMAASTVDALAAVGTDDPAHQPIIDSFRQQMGAIKTLQAPNGMFHTILDDVDTYLEMSATAALGYAALKGARLGVLDESFVAVGEKAVQVIMEHIKPNGIVDLVSSGTSGFIAYDEYNKISIAPRLYGQALAILALTEQLHRTK
ncbi:MAG: glycoside hydrolase family 88 protein [Anaerolineae bacterium]|nr:glycoside hydrolase family 88 protein [Anaerolineae bacterium]